MTTRTTIILYAWNVHGKHRAKPTIYRLDTSTKFSGRDTLLAIIGDLIDSGYEVTVEMYTRNQTRLIPPHDILLNDAYASPYLDIKPVINGK